MVNKVILVGNLGRDPEVRSMPNGGNVANASLATTRKWKSNSGEKQEETTWHNLVVFGKLADVFERYLTKGSKVYVEGRIQNRSWDDKTTGEKKYRTEVVVEQLTMLGGGANGNAAQKPAQGSMYDQSADAGANEPGADDDIPFLWWVAAAPFAAWALHLLHAATTFA